MSIEKIMVERLQEAINPTHLQITNQSHLHSGHTGDDGSGESHFKIEISAAILNEVGRVERERMIHKALGDVMNKIHALSIKIIP